MSSQISVQMDGHVWWVLAGQADEGGITLPQLLEELSYNGSARAAADRRAAREQQEAAGVLATIRERYRDTSVQDDDFLAWLEEVLPA